MGENEKTISIAGRTIKIGGPSPEIREGERLLWKTTSVCPECYRLLPAIIIEREGKAWIRRVCPEHGEIEEVYWGDVEMLKKAMKYKVKPSKIHVTYTELKAPCPFSCGLCPLHQNYSALINLVATNRCDLSCWYCFFYAEKAGYVYEPTLDQIKDMLASARKQYPYGAIALQITGGEPLLRDDLVDIVKIARDLGYTHIQLNTDGLRFSYPEAIDLIKRLRWLDDGRIGVNTVYLSFDAVSPINFKNHWEVPFILDNLRKGGLTSVVLVPTVVKGWNTEEVGDIIRFAAENIDIIRGVNFQPISITGRVPRAEREKYRITIPEVIKLIEDQTDGEIPKESWYPVPVGSIISDYLSKVTKRPYIRFANHPACGMATYIYVERSNGEVRRLVPITEFVDIDGLLEFLKEETEKLEKGGNRYLSLLRLLRRLGKFIDKEKCPEELKLTSILRNIILHRNYSALGKFHYKFLFIGMMHFMDLYNYDVQRVMRCNIHYVVPTGEIIPFCTFNVLSDLYRDRYQKEFSVPIEKWIELHGEDTVGDAIKHKRDVKKLESSELYKKTYKNFMRNWRK
ncbi:MAG: radical SAM protein [Thermoprotei archaeon]|nr:MAG: radical SAM protein [Thermoprotei archaeon]